MTTAALSVKLCYPAIIEKRDQRCIDKMTTLSTLPSSCWTGTSSDTFARKRKTSGGSSWNLPTAPPTLALLVSLAQAGRQVVEPATKHFNCLRRKNPLFLEGDCAFKRQFNACSVLQDQILRRLRSKIHYHHRVDPSYRIVVRQLEGNVLCWQLHVAGLNRGG